MFQPAKGFMQGINTYVPGMQWSASLSMNDANTFSLGKPIAAAANTVANALVTNTTVGAMTWLPAPYVCTDAPYGKLLVVTPSASATTTIDIWGEDYLGQPMVERAAFSASAAALNLKKAWYRILGTKLVVAGGAITLNIGFQDKKLGLPFKGSIEWAKEGSPPATVIDPSTLFSNWTAPDWTDPATATSGDPRGVYTSVASFDGVKEFIIGMRCDNALNANNNGGLHGIRQFAA